MLMTSRRTPNVPSECTIGETAKSVLVTKRSTPSVNTSTPCSKSQSYKFQKGTRQSPRFSVGVDAEILSEGMVDPTGTKVEYGVSFGLHSLFPDGLSYQVGISLCSRAESRRTMTLKVGLEIDKNTTSDNLLCFDQAFRVY